MAGLPPWGFQALLVLGTVIVSAGIYLSEPVPGDAAMFYVWVVLYASY
jgi:hypothetical protein